jgi:hypothetical protein
MVFPGANKLVDIFVTIANHKRNGHGFADGASQP